MERLVVCIQTLPSIHGLPVLKVLPDLKKAETETDPIDGSSSATAFFEGREDRRITGMKLYSVLSSLGTDR